MNLTYYILLFFVYSFLGWIVESINEIVGTGKFVNRGFLIGPILPIYGCGGVLITLLLSRYYDDPVVLFIMAIVICSLLEYFTSYFMEKIFKARWWDYTNRKYNINGRVCLETMIPFGLLGLLSIYLIKPSLVSILDRIPMSLLNVIVIILISVIIIDMSISFNVIINFKNTLKKIDKDNTEEITKKIKQVLMEKSTLHRRLLKAFPKLNIKNFKIKTTKKQ